MKPLKKILGEKGTIEILLDVHYDPYLDDPRFVAYINRRLEVVQAYCANILFYIRLRAKASQALQDHPVIGRLAQFKSILNKITSEKTQDYAKVYLEIYEDLRLQRKEVDEEQSDAEEQNEDHLADFEALTEGKRARTNNEDDEGEESEYDEDGKRKITYKMSKNKGFIPKRQKKRRNPRVKHRGKFEYLQNDLDSLKSSLNPESAHGLPGLTSMADTVGLKYMFSGLFGCIETKKGSCSRSTKGNDKIFRRGIWNQSWSQKVCSDQKLIKYSHTK